MKRSSEVCKCELLLLFVSLPPFWVSSSGRLPSPAYPLHPPPAARAGSHSTPSHPRPASAKSGEEQFKGCLSSTLCSSSERRDTAINCVQKGQCVTKGVITSSEVKQHRLEWKLFGIFIRQLKLFKAQQFTEVGCQVIDFSGGHVGV